MTGPWQWHFADGAWLNALWVVPIAATLAYYAYRKRSRAIMQFAGHAKRGPVLRAWALKSALFALALALSVIAVARPQGEEKEESVSLRGRDLVFMVDVSRSMLASDVKPNRLERAKLWITDLTKGLKGDRVALVAFAGASSVKCPLTLDYAYFRLALEELSPQSVQRGGTLIGDAIRKALTQIFDSTPGRFRDIILITDGEDHESFPAQAAAQAGEQGVRILALGIGSENEGAVVPRSEESPGEFVEYEGEQVHSKMDSTGLAQIAAASAGGVFLNVGTGTIDLERVYSDLIAGAESSEIGTRVVRRYDEKYQFVLALALALLIAESLIDDRRR